MGKDVLTMNLLATVVGMLAVALFVFSYQLKSRRNIILCNTISRVLYVAQYCLLGAFEGALLDGTAFFISLLCYDRDMPFIKKHVLLFILLSNVVIIGIGMVSYKDIFSLLPILGVIFEILALWLKKERNIRIISLLAAPFWLAYNLLYGAYGSAVGNVITIISLLVALFRYDILGKEHSKGNYLQK